MNKDLISNLEELLRKTKNTWEVLDLDSAKIKMKILEAQMNEPDFWNNTDKAKKISKEHEAIKKEISTWRTIEHDISGLLEIAQIASDEKGYIKKEYEKLVKQFEKLEFYVMFDGEYDKDNAVVSIHAGAGGVDAQDWAAMLERMMMRYCESNDFQIKIIDRSVGNEAGIKKTVIEVTGRYAYGYLRSENGVHRLVRISPFDAENMRHTSFALIEVMPELNEVSDVVLKSEDLKIDTFRASGNGGQSVNTTDSAVRIKHQPSGIIVTCQNERSQHQNKETALKILKSRLHLFNKAEKEEEKKNIRGEYSAAEWGNQIRSYVLHPYQMVKDHRTKYEEKDPQAVLDGKIDGFVEAYLKDKK